LGHKLCKKPRTLS